MATGLLPGRTVSTLGLLAVLLTFLLVSQALGEQDAYYNSPYGLTIGLAPQSAAEASMLDLVMDAGVDWVRIDFPWAWIEPSKGVFNWSVPDKIRSYVQARALAFPERPLHVYASYWGPPEWARQYPGTSRCELNDTQDWVDFMTKAVQRYTGIIDHWGFFNEPDLGAWGNKGTALGRQTYIDQVVIPGADAIHAANPNAKVVAPETSYLGSGRWYYWLRDVIEQAGDKIDIVSTHVYGQNRSTLNSRLNANTIAGGNPSWWTWFSPSLREVLEYTGWDGPVWLSEVGWESYDKPSQDGTQGELLTAFLDDWFTGHPDRDWLDKAFIYALRDDPWDPDSWGLLWPDGTPKDGFFAYRDFMAANPIPGDFDGDFDSDGDVDGDDFLAWQNGFPISAGAALLDGDADADGDVDGDDFLVWQRNYPYPAAVSSVPEPNSLVLLALGGLMMLRRTKHPLRDKDSSIIAFCLTLSSLDGQGAIVSVPPR